MGKQGNRKRYAAWKSGRDAGEEETGERPNQSGHTPIYDARPLIRFYFDPKGVKSARYEKKIIIYFD
jgi:hypothetical protein